MDIKSAEKRSENMAAIKSSETKPEQYIRSLLFKNGFRYRKNKKNMPGKPDIWLAKYNTAIFVNGCFWHRHTNCKYAYVPKSRIEFWNSKFEKNIQRDRIVIETLNEMGIKSLVVWECTVRKMEKSTDEETRTLNRLIDFMLSDRLHEEI